VQQKLG